ncbi:hypothetical protein RHSIM_Rhsim12G0195400 [Rhododendron simsii]|uniref:GB1/RHD3-type G domain-containing protein n=1 Tax=Rhododendron simsii TaxID=118357 RepID=A0A834L9C6_RHOSS|nr:hypothetical protein RHSIM_Rhsim12G0195400 [Rhododendron simsii]
MFLIVCNIYAWFSTISCAEAFGVIPTPLIAGSQQLSSQADKALSMAMGNECFETHLIEEDGTLNLVEFDKFTKKVDLAACELNYVVVSIMGPQSSGKSTLLNHMFGPKFKEMDRRQGRHVLIKLYVKTTRGIWLARCADIEPCTLVMDVEGSDGRERGEISAYVLYA